MARSSRDGFALIVTLTLMAALTLLVIGLAGLASVTRRTSLNELSQARAKANARLSLMLALGNLQKHAGPDQRVTATAEITGTATNKHWLGVWKTTRTVAGKEEPVADWVAGGSDTGIRDARSDGTVTNPSLFLQWLASGNSTPAAAVTASSPRVKLLGKGSTGLVANEVDVPLVGITSATAAGGHAYWVSDQSGKASIVTGGTNQLADGAASLAQPSRYGIAVLSGLDQAAALTDTQLARITHREQFPLAGLPATSLRNNWCHGIAIGNHAVLADPLRGGLKKDLSVYLLKADGNLPADANRFPGVGDATPLLPDSRRASHGPKLGSLRAWAKLAGRGGDGSVPAAAATATVAMDKFLKAPDLGNFHGQPIHPVLASAQLYTRFSYIRGYLVVHLYPRVVLWNPFNAKITAAEYTVDFNQAVNDSLSVRKADDTVILNNTAYDTRGNSNNRLRLSIERTAFDPGEALVFTPKPSAGAIGGLAMPMVPRNATGQNVMSAQSNPRGLTNFYLTLNALPGITGNDLPIKANHNEGSYYWIDMMDWWSNNPDNGLKVGLFFGGSNSYDAMRGLPLLQLVDTDNWKRSYNGRFNNGRWKVGGIEPVYNYETTTGFEPWQRTNYGFRYKWWAEKNPTNLAGTSSNRYWQAAVLADYNLRAPLCHRSPFDNITDNGEAHHWYLWGPYAVESVMGLPYLSPELAAHPSANGYRANLFFGGASSVPAHVYPVYDVPRPGERIISPGRFQHAQLTPYLWHTAYPIGNSLVPVNIKNRDRSADPGADVDTQWTGQITYLPAWLAQNRGGDQVVYDLSYETNHMLWDRYFLSGATSAEKTAFLANPSAHPLSNRRLVLLPGASGGGLADYNRAAAHLLLAGGFNVNSCDPGAWRALLASLRGLKLADATPGTTTPFPRGYGNPGTVHEPTDPFAPEVWTGTRRLSDAQIGTLADKIVVEVKKRGPFLSVADFVNRRLVPATSANQATGLAGALQAAIDSAGLNAALADKLPLAPGGAAPAGYGNHSYEPGGPDATVWADPAHLRASMATGLPTQLQQADILQPLGSLLVARGDTFLIRCYGDARSADGKTIARAWAEAEVQRLPEFLDPIDPPETPEYDVTGARVLSLANRQFGRRFRLVSFRWLNPDEV